MNDYFYGWYFRCQGEESIAVIPAVHLGGGKGNCSIQVVTEAGSLYQEFPIDQFRISPDRESSGSGNLQDRNMILWVPSPGYPEWSADMLSTV